MLSLINADKTDTYLRSSARFSISNICENKMRQPFPQIGAE
jgi:hypothetical protein